MKELIYRRAATGYTIDRSAEGISQAKRHTGSQYVGIAMDETSEGISYRQFRLDDGTIALGAAYLDKYGDRKSILGHIVYADEDEVEQLLDSYPSCTSYFSRFKNKYALDQSLAGDNSANMDFALKDFLEPRKDGLKVKVLEVLKRIFPVRENLEKMFNALMDVASNNPRMILILGPDEEDEKEAERGRQIIETLFSCVPNVISRRIGYISPAVNDKGNTVFGIRYSKKREIDKEMRSFAYIYNYVENSFQVPPKANTAANEYASELADLVFQCDQKAVERIQELKTLLNDPALYNNESVPEDIIIRYRFYNGHDKLTIEEKEKLLSWHAGVVKNIRKTENEKEKTNFWNVVNRWLYEVILKSVFVNAQNMERKGAINSFERLKEVFETAQLMHEMNWKEARIYRDYFELLISEKIRLTPENKSHLDAALVSEVIKKVKSSKTAEDLNRSLYWADIEKWFEKEYRKGAFFANKEVFAIVAPLYSLNTKYAGSYVDAYADYCEKNDVLLTAIVGTDFGKKVAQKLISDRRKFVVEQLSREMKKANPFLSKENQIRYIQYKSVIGADDELKKIYNEACETHFTSRLSGMQKAHIEMLVNDFNMVDPDNSMSGIMHKVHPSFDAKAEIEKKIIELAKNDGIIPFYPEKAQLAKELAGILDAKYPQADYRGKLRILERANRIHTDSIENNEFDRLMEEGFGESRDSVLSNKIRELILKNVSKANQEKAYEFDKLLMLFAVRNRTDGAFNPVGIIRDLKKAGYEGKKLAGQLKKLAKSDENRGIGYVASVLMKYANNDNDIDEWEEYPGEIVKKSIKKIFSGFPMVAAVALLLVSGSGLAFSAIGIMKTIGLL